MMIDYKRTIMRENILINEVMPLSMFFRHLLTHLHPSGSRHVLETGTHSGTLCTYTRLYLGAV